MIKRYCLVVFVCLTIQPMAWAQTDESGARALALGGAVSAMTRTGSTMSNPASFSQAEKRSITLFTSQAFGLSELRLGMLDGIIPTAIGHVAVGGRTFGFENYRENRFTVGYSSALSLGTRRSFSIGAALDYYTLSISSYGSASAVGIGVGWMTQVTTNLRVGGQARNINGPSLTDQVGLEHSLSVGLAYTASEQVLLLLDANKESRFPLSVRGGLEFSPLDLIALRTGFTTTPVQYSAGIGIRLASLHTDLAGSFHEDLGWSPALAFAVLW